VLLGEGDTSLETGGWRRWRRSSRRRWPTGTAGSSSTPAT
jgi:hypothetical protein